MSTAHQRYMQLRKDELYHFNPNHDPKDGKFTSGPGGASSGSVTSQKSGTFKPRAVVEIEKADLITTHNFKDSPEQKQRMKAAADLGLNALNKMGRQGYDKSVGITNNDRNWFVYEDQTIGLATIADLVNRGKSKKDIRSLVNTTKDVPYEHIYDSGIFELDYCQSYYLDNGMFDAFVDACQSVLKENKNAARADYDGEKTLSKTSIEEHTIKNSIATGGFRITKGDVHDASNKLLAIYKREKVDPRTPGISAFNDADRINQELKKKCSSGLSNISKETPENKAAIEKAYASSTNVGSLAKDLYQKIQRDSQYSRTDSLGKQYTEKQKTFDEDVKELGRLIREYDDAYFKEFGKRLMIV